MVQKYPSNSHVLIMEDSSNYGEISSSITKTSKADYHNNYSTPFYIRHGTSNTDTKFKAYSNPPEATQHEDDFFKSIKGFLIFGKLIGVLPFSGIFGNSWRDMSYRLVISKNCLDKGAGICIKRNLWLITYIFMLPIYF